MAGNHHPWTPGSEDLGISEDEVAIRIDRMAWRDRLIALVFVAAMWLVLLFVYVVAVAAVPTGLVTVALTVSLLLLGLVNTASIFALIRRYGDEKDHVYRDDVLNLERNRRGRRSEGS